MRSRKYTPHMFRDTPNLSPLEFWLRFNLALSLPLVTFSPRCFISLSSFLPGFIPHLPFFPPPSSAFLSPPFRNASFVHFFPLVSPHSFPMLLLSHSAFRAPSVSRALHLFLPAPSGKAPSVSVWTGERS